MYKIFTFLLLSIVSLRGYTNNIVPNSSFENGIGRGWHIYTLDDVAGETKSMLAHVTNGIVTIDGSYYLSLEYAEVVSRAMWLTSGTYTASGYFQSDSGNITLARLGIVSFDAPGSDVTLITTITNGGWIRASVTQTISSNGFYHWKAQNKSSSGGTNLLIDAVQLEPGSTATAYHPSADVELGLITPYPDNMIFVNQSNKFQAVITSVFDHSVSSNLVILYGVYDTWNRLITNIVDNRTVTGMSTFTNTYNFPKTNGWIRIDSRIGSIDDSWDSTSVACFSFVSNTFCPWLGMNSEYSDYHLMREYALGVTNSRYFSPALYVRWFSTVPNQDIEHTEGILLFDRLDKMMSNAVNHGIVIVANLASGIGGTSYPTWATNKTFPQFVVSYSNFCYQVCARYTDQIWGAQIWNEADSGGPTTPWSLRDQTNYSILAEAATIAIKLASPNTYVMYGSGWSVSQPTNLLFAVTNMATTNQSKIGYIDHHKYPGDASDGNSDPNVSYYGDGQTALWLRQTWVPVSLPWVITEVGTVDAGTIQGLNNYCDAFYRVQGYAPAPEASRNVNQIRGAVSVDRMMNFLARYLGNGTSLFELYDRRHWYSASWLSASYYSVDYNGVDKAHSIALMNARSFLSGPGFGQITNTSVGATLMELYGFTNLNNQYVITIFNTDRTNRTVTVSNNNFAIYDVMGNYKGTNISPIIVNRTLQYLVSGSITPVQFSNTLKFGTAATIADTNAPNLSVVVAPSGIWDTNNPFGFIQWYGYDTEVIPTAAYSNKVTYAWAFDDAAFSPFTQSNHLFFGNLIGPGNHKFSVVAQDEVGNTNRLDYQFYLNPIPQVTNRLSGPFRITGKRVEIH